MATDDIQRLVAGRANAPTHFKIPGNGQIRPKAIYAAYDGSGAATAFKPALKVTSDAGELVGIYDTDDEVAAGASANVSWFPGGGLGGGATATAGAAWFFASRLTNQNIPGLDSSRIGWTHHVTSDSSVFSVTTSGVTDDTVNGLKEGIYIATMDVLWKTPQNYARSSYIISDFFNTSAGIASPLDGATTDTTAAGDIQHVHDAAICLTQSVPGEISVKAQNLDGVTHAVTVAQFAIVYLPNSTLVS